MYRAGSVVVEEVKYSGLSYSRALRKVVGVMKEALVASRNEEEDSVLTSTYRAPQVAVRPVPVAPVVLPADPTERELMLSKWSDDLTKWQASLESASHSGSAPAAERVPNWPPLVRFVRFDLQELPLRGQRGMRWLHRVFLFELLLGIYNGVALAVTRATVGSASADADLVRAFVLVLVFGSLGAFAVHRMVYTGVRKLRRVLMAECLVWLAVQVCAELFLAAGVPNTVGAAGFLAAYEARASPAALALLCVSGALWTAVAVAHVVEWLWLRQMLAEMRRSLGSADDAYRRFEESAADMGGSDALAGAREGEAKRKLTHSSLRSRCSVLLHRRR